MPNTGLYNWDFRDKHVQSSIERDGSYISSESQLIAFGPPYLSDMVTALGGTVTEADARTIPVAPCGLVENFSFSQAQQLMKIFEIGSSRSYTLGGRSDGNLSFSRILYHGPSALRMVYAAYRAKNGAFNALVGNGAPGVRAIDIGSTPPGTVNAGGEPDHDYFFNLQNILFRQPVGGMLFMKSLDGKGYAGLYFEDSLVGSYASGTSSAGIVVQEQVAMRFDRIVPMQVRFTSLPA